jgi:hypothetical protein
MARVPARRGRGTKPGGSQTATRPESVRGVAAVAA